MAPPLKVLANCETPTFIADLSETNLRSRPNADMPGLLRWFEGPRDYRAGMVTTGAGCVVEASVSENEIIRNVSMVLVCQSRSSIQNHRSR